MLIIKPFTWKENKKDYKYILKHLRKIDKLEIELSYSDVGSWIQDKHQRYRYIGYNDGVPVLLYGLYTKRHEWGNIIWCIGTDDIKKCTYSFVRKSKGQLKEWKKYGDMWNFVLSENTESIRWLTTVGACWKESVSINHHHWVRFSIKGGK